MAVKDEDAFSGALMPDYAHWFRLGSDFFELIIARLYTGILKQGDCCLDVGANHGVHTVPLANCVGLSGRVVAYEAVPALAEVIRRVTHDLPQVETINIALSDRAGKASFRWAKAGDGYSGLRERDMPPEAKASIVEIHVDTDTIDNTLALLHRGPLRNLRFIKMDIEGGEFHALKGAEKTLNMMRPVVVLENGRERMAKLYGYSRDDWFGLFDRVSYRLFDLFGRPFDASRWDEQPLPWYSIAVPKGSADEVFVLRDLPMVIAQMAAAPLERLQRPREP